MNEENTAADDLEQMGEIVRCWTPSRCDWTTDAAGVRSCQVCRLEAGD